MSTDLGRVKKQIVLILLSFFFLNISYDAGPTLVPLKNPSKRIPDMGLSILPPQGGGWFFLDGNPNGGLMFTKTMGSPQHMVVCSLTIVPISENIQGTQEFLETVKQMQMFNVDLNRFKNIKSNFTLNERFGSTLARMA